eukprot:278453_1
MNRLVYEGEKLNAFEIIVRILVLQFIFYVILGTLLILIDGQPKSVFSLLFDSNKLSFGDGYMISICYILTSFPCAYITTLIVKRAKRSHKCLDYVSAIYMFHFLLCWIVEHFPSNLTWWFINTLSFVIMAGLAEYVFNRKKPKSFYAKLDHTISTDDMFDTVED